MSNLLDGFINFIKNLFLLKYLPDLNSNTSYSLLFIFGIITSVHCIGMCGGIVISQTIGKTKNRNEIIFSSLYYNLGRIVSYTLVGAIVGGFGQIIGINSVLKSIIPILGGTFMIIMAINLLGKFSFLRCLTIRIPKVLVKKIREVKNCSPIYIGLTSGLMPCGPLQIVELYSLGTRSIVIGALSMFIFSLGTTPILFVLGVVNSIINHKYSSIMLKVSAIVVLILGFGMINRGLALSGFSIDSVIAFENNSAVASTINGKTQVVITEIKSDKYDSILVQKGIPVKWTIKVELKNLNDCNNTIIIPKYKIEKKLEVGNNFIEFTPAESGEIEFSCWMGMIKSKIIVVDKIQQ